MSTVTYPSMRREVMSSLAALSDPGYQERVWVNRQFPHANFYDDLQQNVHTLYDDCAVIPEPEGRLGSILLLGDEIGRLKDLDRALGPMIDDFGTSPEAVYLADPRWAKVISAAGSALAAMVLAGGYNDE